MPPAQIGVDVAGGVATLTLDRPERRNALTPDMLRGLRAAVQAAGEDPAVRAVVLTGAGERAFCAGADLESVVPAEGGPDPEHALFVELFTACDRLGKPLLGAVNGAALAGGLGLVLCCDLVVAADSATFGTPEVRVGLWPMMVMALGVRHLGPKRAMQLFLTGEAIAAAEAREWGLVNRVLPAPEVLPATQRWAAELASWSPLTLRMGRDAFHAIDGMEMEQALHHLQGRLTLLARSEDAREGTAAFRERRAPRFRGR